MVGSMRIVILARKHLQFNTRVERQAKAFVQAGHAVQIITLQSEGLLPREHKDGYEIIRLKLDPLHYRIPRGVVRGMGTVIHGVRSLQRWTFRFLQAGFRWLRKVLVFPLKVLILMLSTFWRALNFTVRALTGVGSRATTIESQPDDAPSGQMSSTDLRDVKAPLDEASLPRNVYRFFLHFLRTEVRIADNIYRFFLHFLRTEVRIADNIWRRVFRIILHSIRLILGRFISLFISILRVMFRQTANLVRWMLRFLAQPLTTLDFTLRVYRMLKDTPADVYQSHDSQALLAAHLLARRHRARFVYDAVEIITDRGGHPGSRWDIWISRLWEGFFIKRTDLVLTPTPVIAEVLRKRYRVVPHLIMNCTWFTSSEDISQNGKDLHSMTNRPKTKILFYSGRITPSQGVSELIRCMGYLPTEVVLVLMGPFEKSYEQECKALIDQEQVQDRVFILPPVAPEQVLYYAAQADVGIVACTQTSLNNYAVLPNKFFEYIMARIPTVAADFPSLREIITREDIGRLYTPSDLQDMARAIQEILEPSTYMQLRENLERAAMKYSWENQAHLLVQLYESNFSRAKAQHE